MYLNRRTGRRRGTALVETVITTSVFLMIIFAMIDLGVGVFRRHLIEQAARQGARAAIVHGSLAQGSWNGGIWGTATFGPATVAANASNPKVLAISPYLSGLDASAVTVTYEWPDSSNVAEKSVRVTVSTTWSPIITSVFGAGPRTISAQSTMLIAH